MIKENQAEFDKVNLNVWHNEEYKGRGITVAVLDDRGMPHEWTNVEIPFPESHTEFNHNSNVCSVIREVAPDVRIISFPWFGNIKQEIIDYIVAHKNEINIVNCSFTGTIGVSQFNRLKELDIPIVCSSGNAGLDDRISKPAQYDWTIAVGAKSEASGDVVSYSNKGKELDCVAYTSIYILNSKKNPFPFTGTSCSAPMVSGMLACYLGWRNEKGLPRLGRDEIRQFIHQNSKDMYTEGHDYKSGYGLFLLPESIPEVKLSDEPNPPIEEEKEVKDLIIDISHHQIPSAIDYDKLAKKVKLAIIRTQYGSKVIDKYYKIHHDEFRKRGVPTAAYAWVRGISIKDMGIEAEDFYNRTKNFNPTFWFLDVEEESMQDMRNGIKAYVKKLRELGVKKVGAYIGHHLYEKFNLDIDDFDAIWIPRYGSNNGQPQVKPAFPCDIWQYTSTGKLDGYSGNLDLNKIISDKLLNYFTNVEVVEPVKPTESIENELLDIKINLHDKNITVKGKFEDGVNYIPVRFLEHLGYKVDWDSGVIAIDYNSLPPAGAPE